MQSSRCGYRKEKPTILPLPRKSVEPRWNVCDQPELPKASLNRRSSRSAMSLNIFYPPLVAGAAAMTFAAVAAVSDPLPPDATYRQLPTLPFSEVIHRDEAMKVDVMK